MDEEWNYAFQPTSFLFFSFLKDLAAQDNCNLFAHIQSQNGPDVAAKFMCHVLFFSTLFVAAKKISTSS